MKKYEVLCGNYFVNGVTYPRHSVIESDRPLTKTFMNAFREVPDSTPLTGASAEEPPDDDEYFDEPKVEKPKAKSTKRGHGRGYEVTKKYPAAAELGFRVYKKDKTYWIYNVDNMTEPINENGLLKEDVEARIQQTAVAEA